MHFGFALDSSDIDMLNIDLLDTRLEKKKKKRFVRYRYPQ